MTLWRLPCSGASRVMAGLGPATHDFPVGYTGILDVPPALAMTWGGAGGSFFSTPGIRRLLVPCEYNLHRRRREKPCHDNYLRHHPATVREVQASAGAG